MDRLNGCDFDSDTMLVTDNRIMLDAAKRHYLRFPVPICKLDKIDKAETKLYIIDTDIAQNEIGRIINTSQWMNSTLWTKHHNGEECDELYCEICKLAVLSGTEIDKAKRDYGVDAREALKDVIERSKLGNERPEFMSVVRKKELTTKEIETRKRNGIVYSENFSSAMQVLQFVVDKLSKEESRVGRECKRVGLVTLLCGLEKKELSNEYKYRDEIISKTLSENQALELWRGEAFKQTDQNKKKFCWEKCQEIESRILNFVKKKMKNEYVLFILVKELDDSKSTAQSVKSLLLSCICSANNNLLDQVMITGKNENRSVIFMDDNGDVDIFGIKHSIELVQRKMQKIAKK
jgi:hypothetical protein